MAASRTSAVGQPASARFSAFHSCLEELGAQHEMVGQDGFPSTICDEDLGCQPMTAHPPPDEKKVDLRDAPTWMSIVRLPKLGQAAPVNEPPWHNIAACEGGGHASKSLVNTLHPDGTGKVSKRAQDGSHANIGVPKLT